MLLDKKQGQGQKKVLLPFLQDGQFCCLPTRFLGLAMLQAKVKMEHLKIMCKFYLQK